MIRKAIAALLLVFVGLVGGIGFQHAFRPKAAMGQTQIPGDPGPVRVPPNGPLVGSPNANQTAPVFPPSGVQSAWGNSSNPWGGIPVGDDFLAMTTEEAINVSVYERANRSVVNISTTSRRPESLLLSAEFEGNGSGIVFDQMGHILTNYHVIDGAQKINVTLFNGDAYPAVLIGQDPDNDIAVVKISAPENLLVPVPWGDSGRLRVGQHIIAIGNPFGLERTMSTGIISSLNRQITSKTKRQIHSIIQIDAALNQGNSGGPLLNAIGELIGMNTAIATRSGDNAGIGFAIPINTIRRVVPQLLANGRVVRPTIGIMQVFETEKGLLVVNLTPKGPAERAGIRGSKLDRRKMRRGVLVVEQEVVDHSQSDLIVAIDGKPVKRSDDLLSVIETKKSGEQVVLTVIREGQPLSIPVVLGGNEN